MKIKYVGAKPIVSQHGVSFDQTKEDSYTYIAPTIELLDALENLRVDKNGIVDLNEWNAKHYNEGALLDQLNRYCMDLDALASEKEEKTNVLIDGLKKKVIENSRLTEDERKAWLGNIAMMRSYYLQYIANELAYRCLLHILADKVTSTHIREIHFPLYHNYGMVLSHLVHILTDHKPAIDASLTFEEKADKVYGKFDTNIPKPIEGKI